MENPGLKPFNSNPFFRITDFVVPARGLVLSLAEFDNTPDLSYIYDRDGVFIESRPSVPKDAGEDGWWQHTMCAKVGSAVFSVDGGISNYSVYKNGVGWLGVYPGDGQWITSHQRSLWVLGITAIVEYSAVSGAVLSSHSFPWDTHRHRTNGTHHVYTYFRGDTSAPDWRYRHILSDATFSNEIVLMEMQETSPITPVNFLDVAINTDRVAVVSHDYVLNISTINIYDLSGVIKETFAHPGQAEMLLMSRDRLYASDALTGIVTMWDITENPTTFDKIYTPAGTFATPSPYVWYGNLAT